MSKQKPPKPAKPYPNFPLFSHQNGQWAKQIRGSLRYFGKWDDWKGSLERYLDERDDWFAGRTPTRTDEITVYALMNRFLTAPKAAIESGELTKRTWTECKQICEAVCDFSGKTVAVSLQ